jgi:hypothetical protein
MRSHHGLRQRAARGLQGLGRALEQPGRLGRKLSGECLEEEVRASSTCAQGDGVNVRRLAGSGERGFAQVRGPDWWCCVAEMPRERVCETVQLRVSIAVGGLTFRPVFHLH